MSDISRRLRPPSGEQIQLTHGAQRVVVVEVGGGLREYTVDGRPVLDGYAADQMADGGRGQPLLPWPNRLGDGEYEFDGRQLRLPIDDAPHHNAIHGLTRWRNWTVRARSSDAVTLGHVLHPQPGYPFTLELALEYALGDDGLTVRTTAVNRGTQRLPFGAGFHPYFTVGTAFVDDAELQLAAQRSLVMDRQRMLPTGELQALAGSELDFSEARPIGPTVLDHCVTDFERDDDGLAHIRLRDPGSGYGVTVWLDAMCRYAQLFTGETLVPERRRRGLAIEPMTCPPNAFRTGTDVLVLEPGEERTVRWGIGVRF